MKDLIVNTMVSEGITGSDAGPYHVALRRGSTTAAVVNADEVREWAARENHDLYQPQEPKLNRKELTRLLQLGFTVPGAELVTGSPTITLTARKDKNNGE